MNNAERAGALVIARLTKALEDLVKLDEWDEKVRGVPSQPNTERKGSRLRVAGFWVATSAPQEPNEP